MRRISVDEVKFSEVSENEETYLVKIPNLTDSFGPCNFVDGVADKPINAQGVRRLYQAHGANLEIYVNEPVEAPKEEAPKEEAPKEEAQTDETDIFVQLQALDKDGLVALAKELGLKVDARLSVEKYREAIKSLLESND